MFVLLKQTTVIGSLISVLSLTLFSCHKMEASLPANAGDLAVETAVAKPSSKPNIILILGDDIGYEVPTYTGGQSYQTPNLDALAQQSMQFSNCYALPMCSPSRFELMTGKYNHRNYGSDSWGNLDLSQRTIGNLLKSAGYTTCITGKWQLNGGDSAIHAFGFDTYSVTNPYRQSDNNDEDEGISIYKNPLIYQNGAFLSNASMNGKYGEDVNRDFLFRFIDSNKNKAKPFFAVWTPNLCHAPFSPTPDDPEFAAWVPKTGGNQPNSDTAFFRSMVAYFDKEIGMLVSLVKSNSNLANNTVILLAIGDNGTDGRIRSQYKGRKYAGGKGHTYYRGIHIPFLAYCPSKIAANVNANLVDFTDFMPTLAGLAKVSVPAAYGTIDGVSFAPQLLGKSYTARTWCFGYYDVNRYGPDNIQPAIYAFDYKYKLYEDSSERFYNYISDQNEQKIILPADMNAEQKKANRTLDSVINSYIN